MHRLLFALVFAASMFPQPNNDCWTECDPDGPNGPEPEHGQRQGKCPEGQHEGDYCRTQGTGC